MSFSTLGYYIMPRAIPKRDIEAAVRIIHKDMFDLGISSREIVWWRDSANWFPHLRYAPEIQALDDSLPSWSRDGQPCEPQIQLAPPDNPFAGELTPHVDQPPPWAGGRRYWAINCVPLTVFSEEQGGIKIWPFAKAAPFIPELNPGDALIMHPDLPHSSVPNQTGGVRMAVYFRYLRKP